MKKTRSRAPSEPGVEPERPKPISVTLDPKLVDMVDRCVSIRKLAGENVSRSRLVSEALVQYLSVFRETLLAQAEAVTEQLAQFEAELDNPDGLLVN